MTWFIVASVVLLASHLLAFVVGCRLGAGHVLSKVEGPITEINERINRMAWRGDT